MSGVAYVGSANATMAAIHLNEEILLRVPVDAALRAYADRIWANASPMSQTDERAKPRNLIAFFRMGSLYFKPSTSLAITLNPFAAGLAALPDKEKKRLGAASLPYADQETGIGAFNLRRALELLDGERDSKVGVKPYLSRLCAPFVRGAMPEIWDDPLARRDFEDSFFHYLEFVAQSPGNRPRIPGALLKRINAEPGITAAKAESQLKSLLSNEGWDPKAWR